MLKPIIVKHREVPFSDLERLKYIEELLEKNGMKPERISEVVVDMAYWWQPRYWVITVKSLIGLC